MLLKLGGVGMALGLAALWWYQGRLLYIPTFGGRNDATRGNAHNIKGFISPDEHNLPFESHTIRTKDNVNLHAWLILQPNSRSCPTIIFFHGNAGNIGFRLPNARALYQYCQCNILLLDYRGYGDSDGLPSEHGLKLDAAAAIHYTQTLDSVDKNQIFLFGRSLGGAVAIHAAKHHSDALKGILVENTFLTIADMVHCLLHQVAPSVGKFVNQRILATFLAAFMTSHWRSRDIVHNISLPILFISGLQDELVPPSHMKQLYDAASNSAYKEFYTVEDGTHNDTFMRDGINYYNRIKNFMQHVKNMKQK